MVLILILGYIRILFLLILAFLTYGLFRWYEDASFWGNLRGGLGIVVSILIILCSYIKRPKSIPIIAFGTMIVTPLVTFFSFDLYFIRHGIVQWIFFVIQYIIPPFVGGWFGVSEVVKKEFGVIRKKK